jgi:hypothetical protein
MNGFGLLPKYFDNGGEGGAQEEVAAVKKSLAESGRGLLAPTGQIGERHFAIFAAAEGPNRTFQRRLYLILVSLDEANIGADDRQEQRHQLGIAGRRVWQATVATLNLKNEFVVGKLMQRGPPCNISRDKLGGRTAGGKNSARRLAIFSAPASEFKS